jgi:hypothetical protein
MLELKSDTLVFTFPEIHPQAELQIVFQRTLRIPDDGKSYPLPPSLGAFPVRHIDDYGENVPEKWRKHGGVMLPIYQSEAMWIAFRSKHLYDHGVQYPFAIKIGAGKRSAVTGRVWSKSLRENDYVVVPPQPWLDGFVVEEGKIRQFIAAPLGSGVTAEEQLSGKAEFGGVQVEVLPMKREAFEKKYPKRPPPPPGRRLLRTAGFGITPISESQGAPGTAFVDDIGDSDSRGDDAPIACAAGPAAAAAIQDMGLGAGGSMGQQVFEDPHGMGAWSTDSTRCFIHLANSLAWRQITKQAPPTAPLTAAEYKSRGLPWFEYYLDNARGVQASKKLAELKTVGQMAPHMLPENKSVKIDKIIDLSPKKKGEVRDGKWT